MYSTVDAMQNRLAKSYGLLTEREARPFESLLEFRKFLPVLSYVRSLRSLPIVQKNLFLFVPNPQVRVGRAGANAARHLGVRTRE